MSFFRPLATLANTIALAHSVFALPFALLALLTAGAGWPSWSTTGLVVACLVTGRTAAMAFNRWADREFDARNPRTARRPSVTGAISPAALLACVAVSAALFVLCAGLLNRTCLYGALPVLAVLLGYSYAKRFTPLAHFWLGVALGLAPLGAHLAARGDLAPLPELGGKWGWSVEFFPLLLCAAVLCWTAGFDLIYACQDHAVDSTEERLHSLPKSLGIRGALVLSALLHVLASLLLAGVGYYAGWGVWYFGAWTLATGLLVYEHWIVRPNDLSRVNMAFFTLNGMVSLLLCAAVFLEKLTRG